MDVINTMVKSEVGLCTPGTLEISPQELVKDVLERACVNQATSAKSAKLIYEGKVLDNNRRVKETGIIDGAVLHLVPKHDDGGVAYPPYTLFENLPMDFKSRVAYESKMIRSKHLPITPLDPHHWIAIIPGQGRWRGKNYTVKMTLPGDYPLSPIGVKWLTPLSRFHPNIFNNGFVCMNLLKLKGWVPEYGIITVYEALSRLLIRPNYEGLNRVLHPIRSIERLANTVRR